MLEYLNDIDNNGNSVYEDYTEQEDEEGYTYYPTCADIDYYWYEDYDFLTK